MSAYDRSPELRPAERAALHLRCHRPRPGVFWRRTPALTRLTQPLLDVIAQVGTDQVTGTGMVPLVLREVQRRDRTYWGWSLEEWRETLCLDYRSFQRYHRSASEYRPQLMGAAYLLHCVSDPHQFGKFNQLIFAKRVFGAEVVENSIERVRQELRRWGYGKNRLRITLPLTLAEIMLVTRSPYLEDIRRETLEQLHRGGFAEYIRDAMVMVSRALLSFGILPAPLPPLMKIHERCGLHYAVADVPTEWLSWAQRWQETSTLRPNTRRTAFYALCKTGRWLAQTHPEVLSPADWTRELAAEYVALVDRMKVGEWAHVETMCPAKIGHPLRAPVKAGHLGVLRRFFQDCQEWGWIARRFDPRRSFATPRPIRALLGPCPRIIADDCWAKLLWAGLNLTAEDLPKGPYGSAQGKGEATRERHPWYPPEMEQALALLWLFSGLRSDEIRRLRVGCVRWQREAVTVAGTDDVRPSPAVCWLEVPAHKTGGAFTKPIDRAAGEAIQAWERVRPEQPLTIDFRTGEAYQCLFSFRGHAMGKAHLNKILIPLLCRKAGVPLRDTYGKITSHRARSTITSQLYSAREPMSIWDLKEWLGHRRLASTEYYVKPTPTKLAKSYTDAEYFQRNLRRIDVLIDQEAIASGAAASGQAWKFYDLGHGYCSYDFFEQCPHRMACAKCSFYVPKASSRAQLLEAKANLQRMKQEIPLQEEERAAVEDGLAAVEKLYGRLADVPTPAGPTPRELQKDSARD